MPDLGLEVLFKGRNMVRLLGGLWVSLRISLIAVAISLPLGVGLGAIMMWKNPITRVLSRIYLDTIRIMPQLVLLFDEVTAALDPEMVREVLDVMLSLAAQGRTMLIVTHEMSFARAVADRIFFVDSGCILEDAPPEQFFSHPQTERARKFLNTFTFQAIKNKHSNHLEEI